MLVCLWISNGMLFTKNPVKSADVNKSSGSKRLKSVKIPGARIALKKAVAKVDFNQNQDPDRAQGQGRDNGYHCLLSFIQACC